MTSLSDEPSLPNRTRKLTFLRYDVTTSGNINSAYAKTKFVSKHIVQIHEQSVKTTTNTSGEQTATSDGIAEVIYTQRHKGLLGHVNDANVR